MATSIQALITEVLRRIGLSTANADNRARALAKANEGERHIAQPGSFLYLSRLYAITLNNLASSIPMPTSPSIDFGKSMSLRIVGEPGYLDYYPHDRFRTGAISSFYALRNDRPSTWSFWRSANGIMTMYFNPANSVGANLSLELVAQQAVQPLIDDTISFSLLPETYEETLLAGFMEAKLRYELSRPGWKDKQDEFDELLEIFYTGQRTSKEEPHTDNEAALRKRADVETDPEA